jgi:chromosome segregation protein
LKFTQVRLSGFKSFVDPTELFIEPGLTGIVGPNGCGKSNLLEAMRWVMGDNRPTSMRGSGMEDVIFSGTGTRPMRNNAEVTLVIDNSDHSAPLPYTEFDTIEVSRRIERDAGSVYRINGRDVRQRDVQIFFADAATGSSSPSLVRQGHIGVLINQKPLLRRAILEEAAGIGGLHQRRHEAELRLKAAETNLARLDDIISEVEGQLHGLKRQARQATRYRNISGVIHKAEAVAFLLRWQSAEEQERLEAGVLHEACTLVAERAERVAKASTAQVEAANALPPLREKESECGAALQLLLHERDALNAEANRAREEAQRISQRIEQAEQDRLREHALEQDATSALASHDEEIRSLNNAKENASEELLRAESTASTVRENLAQQEQNSEKMAEELADLNAKRASLEHNSQENSEAAARANAQLQALSPQQLEAESEIAEAPGVLAAEATVSDARRKVTEAKNVFEQASAVHATAIEADNEARAPFEAAERKVQNHSAEANALATLLHRVDRDLWPPVIDSLRVEPGYEAALAAALGDDLDAPLDQAAPQHWRDFSSLEDVPSLPDGATPLSRFVQGPSALARRLAFTGVVSPERGRSAHSELKPGQRLVSKNGDLWRWDGYCVSADAQSSAAIRLAQRNRLDAIEGELKNAKIATEVTKEKYSAAQSAAAAAREAAQDAEHALRRFETQLMAAQDESANIARVVGEKTAQLATIAADIRGIREGRETARRAEAVANEARASCCRFPNAERCRSFPCLAIGGHFGRNYPLDLSPRCGGAKKI